MKKKIILISLTGIIFLLSGIGGNIANAREIPWARGMRSEQVKVIQEILKEDSKIYPEGYVTGYFGPLTEKAIKRLQKKFRIPATGVVDKETKRCIFPIEFGIRVISPNGEEIWNRNQIQIIEWEVETTSPPEDGIKPYPFWKKASIDLFRKINEKSVFVKHIATVNLFDKVRSWKISGDISNGKDYLIRISLGPGVGSIWYREKIGKPLPSPEEIWPTLPLLHHIFWDESDEPFEITGVIPPPPVPDIEKVIAILERMILELQKAIALLKGINR